MVSGSVGAGNGCGGLLGAGIVIAEAIGVRSSELISQASEITC